jgi:hypothetical protein
VNEQNTPIAAGNAEIGPTRSVNASGRELVRAAITAKSGTATYVTWDGQQIAMVIPLPAVGPGAETANIIVTPEQLHAAAGWVLAGPDMARVTLITDGSGLLQLRQGDDGTAFAADGTEQDEGDDNNSKG